jgi:dTDP-4-dehydrorhamnose reductase
MAGGGRSKVLVLGATGMLGSAVLRFFAQRQRYAVAGSVRAGRDLLPAELRDCVIEGVDATDFDHVARLFDTAEPDVVINCIGVVKQLAEADDPLVALPINSLLPHRLARLCESRGARLLHVSTDCVFSGKKEMYTEADSPDAEDLYGRSKLLGEVDYPHAVTLRTSIIGHELKSAHGLLEWFLAQSSRVHGYTKAVFSGFPTVEIALVMHDYILETPGLRGVYHVSSDPITKYALLKLISRAYGHEIEIDPDDRIVIDRSLDSTRFRAATGYVPPPWPELVDRMRRFG